MISNLLLKKLNFIVSVTLIALGAGLWHLLKVQKCPLNLYHYPINTQSLILPLKVINIYLME